MQLEYIRCCFVPVTLGDSSEYAGPKNVESVQETEAKSHPVMSDEDCKYNN